MKVIWCVKWRTGSVEQMRYFSEEKAANEYAKKIQNALELVGDMNTYPYVYRVDLEA